MSYQEQSFNLPVMEGLSQKQIEAHLKLYAGYVKNVNTLDELRASLSEDPAKNAVLLSELTRRYGFEWNGMRLHEHYFSALGGDGTMEGACANAIAAQFGSHDAWKAAMKSVAMMRGIGWTLLVRDPQTQRLSITWISDHEIGHLAGCDVLFALDVWEHAFLLDYLPAERGTYIDAVFKNMNWSAVETRW